jgi:glyoxylase-like metal-dependent hydrolase (beta-lactamase superfamily II)
MLEIKTFDFGPFGTNTYVLSDENKKALIIDPACSNQYEQQVLYRYIQLQNLQVQAILATHGHLDHLWGARWATEQWSLPVLMHEADIPMAKDMQGQYNLFGIHAVADSFPMESLKSQISNLKSQISNFQLLETPGHTPGSICLYREKEKVLLSGDTLFRMGYGRTDLPGGDFHQLIASLDNLFTLPADVRVYPGHGDPTTIAAERR